jgi:uncharacterized protein involved in exopolysaccharide biosynthesis
MRRLTDGDGLSLVSDVLVPVFKYSRTGLCFLAACVLGSVAFFLIQPKVYASHAALMVTGSRADVALGAGQRELLVNNAIQDETLNNELELLFSPTLHLRTAALLAPELDEEAQAKLAGEFGFEADRRHRTNIIEVSTRAESADVAHRNLATLIDTYFERRAEVLGTPRAVSFYDRQIEDARLEMETVRAGLNEELLIKGVGFLEDGNDDPLQAQKRLGFQRLSEYQSQLDAAMVTKQEISKRVSALRRQLASEPEHLTSANRFQMDPQLEELERGLASLRLERDDLLQRYTPQSTRVSQVESQIRMVEERIATVEAKVGLSGTERNPLYQELRRTLMAAEGEASAAQASIAELQQQIEREQATMNALTTSGPLIEDLHQQLKLAKERLESYERKRETARLSADLDASQLVNVSLIDEPSLEPDPVSQGYFLIGLAALVLGVLGGLALAFFRGLADQRLVTENDLSRLGVHPIGLLPEAELR